VYIILERNGMELSDNDKKIKRINFEIETWLHKKLKIIAVKRNITLREVMLRAVSRLIAEDEVYK
jgi:hypothetical protein